MEYCLFEFQERGKIMKLNAPKNVTWIIAAVLAVLALVVKFAGLAAGADFWLALASAVLLLCASFFAGL